MDNYNGLLKPLSRLTSWVGENESDYEDTLRFFTVLNIIERTFAQGNCF